ncbi:MAG: hypothetical protein BRD36_02410, partial [Bacteroidetes bacterium QH_7_64_110]
FLLGFALFASPAQAQDDLGDALETVGQQYADGYTKPVTDALGANLNAGLFRTAEVGGEGVIPVIDVYVGVAGMGALTAGLEDSFRPTDDQVQTENDRTLRIEYPNTDFPTAFGENESPGRADVIDRETGMKVDEAPLPSSLIDTPIAPLGVPQVGVGTVLGTDAQLRYLPETNISSYGSVSLFGLSVRHSLSQYIPLSPLNVAVQGTWQSLALYTFATNGETSTIAFDQDAANSVRALAGVSVTLAVIQLNVDYALGSTNTVSAGVGLAL